MKNAPFDFKWLYCLFFLVLGLTSPTFATDPISPSFTLIPEGQKTEYLYWQEHGFCKKVWKIERTALLLANPSLAKTDDKYIKRFTLGHERCHVLRTFAETFAIPKIKGGEKLYATYAPKPRLGNFMNPSDKDMQDLLKTRDDKKAIDRPIDWQEDPMPLQTEIRMHQAYTTLVKLGFCSQMPAALQDLGNLFDQNFALLNPYLLYGLFSKALAINVDRAAMQTRLHRIDDTMPPFERVRLENMAKDGHLKNLPQMQQLYALCKTSS